MKVTVTKYLNVRVGKPSVNAPCYQYLAPGSELEVDGKLYMGDKYSGNDQWYKDDGGNYYWSGGVEAIKKISEAPQSDSDKYLKSSVNYNIEFEGLDNFRSNMGDNVPVAVFDSGIFEKHSDFPDKFIPDFPSRDFTSSSQGFSDVFGHGSHVAGLIGASSSKGVTGIAPKCKLWNIKTINDTGVSYGQFVANGIDELIKSTVKLINLSLELSVTEFKNIESKFLDLKKKGIIPVAAAGENDSLLRYSYYPGFDKNVISVGAISPDFSLEQGQAFHESVDYIIPMLPLRSCSTKENGFYSSLSGSSMSSALVTGIVALILNKYANADISKIKTELDKISVPYKNNLDKKSLKLIKP
uniref:S8 family peptidase n=1 Tax=Fulvivirga sp. TaxID=1931237 RepID=UPI00404B4A10